MMLPASLIPTTPLLSTALALPSMTVSAGAPSPVAVFAALPDAAAENETLPSVIVPARVYTSSESETASKTAAAAKNAMAYDSQSIPPQVRYSSQFLAQMISQLTPDEGVAAARLFSLETSPPTSILDSRVIQLFGQVKYRPSDARLSEPRREAAAESPSLPVVKPADPFPLPVAGNDNRKEVVKTLSFVANPSIRPRGVQAYASTQDRNDAALAPKSQALRAALSSMLSQALAAPASAPVETAGVPAADAVASPLLTPTALTMG